jgi:hypothetical protein
MVLRVVTGVWIEERNAVVHVAVRVTPRPDIPIRSPQTLINVVPGSIQILISSSVCRLFYRLRGQEILYRTRVRLC